MRKIFDDCHLSRYLSKINPAGNNLTFWDDSKSQVHSAHLNNGQLVWRLHRLEDSDINDMERKLNKRAWEFDTLEELLRDIRF